MDDQIRVIKKQEVDSQSNQTLIILPSFAKAWEIWETCMLDKDTNPLARAQMDGLNITLDKHEALDSDTVEERQRIVDAVWKEITQGPRKDFIATIEAVSSALIEVAAAMDPSLRPVNTWKQAEEGPIFDAGLIASEDEKPCFSMTQPQNLFRKGDGQAFRLLINTDTCAGHSDAENCIATISLVRCLMHFGEVELWIQQGWIGPSPKSGVTLFPIHKGQEITPAMTWFWLASGYRDSTFSRVVNLGLGRKNSGVSQNPQMEHDIYIANAIGTMPNLPGVPQMAASLRNGKPLTEEQQKSLSILAEWLAGMVRNTVYSPEAIAHMEAIQ